MVTKLTIRLNYTIKRLDEDCPDCGFQSLIRITAVELLNTGVKTWIDKTMCGRCEDMRKSDG